MSRLIDILLLILLVSCGGGEELLTEPESRPLAISGVADSYTMAMHSRDGGTVDDDEKDCRDGVVPETLGVYAMIQNVEYPILENTQFYHLGSESYEAAKSDLQAIWHQDNASFDWETAFATKGNEWPYAPLRYWTPERQYQFYGYSPHSSAEGTLVSLATMRYGSIATFTMERIPPYSSYPYMIGNGYVEPEPSTEVPLDLHNISARICVRLKLGERYSRLRQVKIKQITINDYPSNAATCYKCTQTFSQGGYSVNIVPNGTYQPPSDDNKIRVIPIFSEPDGLLLSEKKYKQFGSLFAMPQKVTNLTINVTYDVYDLNGILVRSDQQTSNAVILQTDVESGKYYNINILVSPAYLYALSDKDVTPTVVMDVSE